MRTPSSNDASPESGWILEALSRHERPLTHYACSILGDVDRARDVVQDTFLKLCNQRREDVASRLAEWLYTVCRNAAIDLKRKHRPAEAPEGDMEVFVHESEAPMTILERNEQTQQLRAMLLQLGSKEQEVLRLRFHGGLSYREIAGTTGLSVNHVGFIIHTALARLREKFTKIQPPTAANAGTRTRLQKQTDLQKYSAPKQEERQS